MKQEKLISIQSTRRSAEKGFFVIRVRIRPIGDGCVAECILIDDFFCENLVVTSQALNLVSSNLETCDVRKRTSSTIATAYVPETNSHVTLFDGDPIDSTLEESVHDIVSNYQELIVPAALKDCKVPFFLASRNEVPAFRATLTIEILIERLCDFPDFISFEKKHERNLREHYYAELVAFARASSPSAGLKLPFSLGNTHGVLILTEFIEPRTWKADAFYIGGSLEGGDVLERRCEYPYSSGIVKISSPVARIINVGEIEAMAAPI